MSRWTHAEMFTESTTRLIAWFLATRTDKSMRRRYFAGTGGEFRDMVQDVVLTVIRNLPPSLKYTSATSICKCCLWTLSRVYTSTRGKVKLARRRVELKSFDCSYIDQGLQDVDDEDEVQFLMSQVNLRSAEILLRKCGIGCDQQTGEEIASSLGVSRQRVFQIIEDSAEKIKKSIYKRDEKRKINAVLLRQRTLGMAHRSSHEHASGEEGRRARVWPRQCNRCAYSD